MDQSDNTEKKTKKIIKLKVKRGSAAAKKSQEQAPPTPKTEQSGERKTVPVRSRTSFSRPAPTRRPSAAGSRPQRPGGRPGAKPDSSSSTTAQKDSQNRNKHRTTHGNKQKIDYARLSKKREEEILLNKMENSIRNKAKKGEYAIPENIEIGEFIKIADLAKKMNLKASVLIQKFIELGTMVTINDTIDADSATIVCEEFKCKVSIHSIKEEVEIKESEDKAEDLLPRPPIVTVMGHVDHGKTKLLDAIRNSNVADHESGGITQHIGAYKVKTKKGDITFIDTPGHEAFTAMRARGAEVTDIVILVVSAVEGVLPQTVEAINHSRSANVPIVVAINKIDLPDANPDRVKQQLSEHQLVSEEWGGETIMVPVSALKGDGIDELLDSVLLQAEIMELKANPNKPAVAYVIESKMDIGKGALATVVVKNGQINVGDYFVVGAAMGKVRALFNSAGQKVSTALPSHPVEIMGFSSPPEAGEKFYVVESDAMAREIANKRLTLKKLEDGQNIKKIQMKKAINQLSRPDMKEFKVIVKADVNGSVEAIKHSLSKLENDEIDINIIHSAVGAVTESDVMLASATAANNSDSSIIILGFRVRVDSIAKEKAESERIEIKRFNIIYELIDYIHALLEGMLSPEISETVIGSATVKEVFKITGVGKIAGCEVIEGFIRRAEKVRLYREGIQVWEGTISALKRFQDDVKEVQVGFECGISLMNYENIKSGDVIECYSSESKKRKLVTRKEQKKNNKDETKKDAD